MFTVYFFKGAYKGFTEKYNKRISPYFKTINEAYSFKDSRKIHSLSLSDSLPSKETFKIVKGFDHFNNKELFQLVGVTNEYTGEWHTTKEAAENELKNL